MRIKRFFSIIVWIIFPLSIIAQNPKSKLLPTELLGVALGMNAEQVKAALEENGMEVSSSSFAEDGALHTIICGYIPYYDEWIIQYGVKFNKISVKLNKNGVYWMNALDEDELESRKNTLENANKIFNFLKAHYILQESSYSGMSGYKFDKDFIDDNNTSFSIYIGNFSDITQVSISKKKH